MSIPKYNELYAPFLKALSDGGVHDIKEIKQDIKEMPDLIVKKVNESVDMKIKLAIAETEKKYMGKFIALLIGLIGEAVGLIISFIK